MRRAGGTCVQRPACVLPHAHSCVQVCVWVRACVSEGVRVACVRVWVRVCVHGCVCVWVRVCMRACVCVHAWVGA